MNTSLPLRHLIEAVSTGIDIAVSSRCLSTQEGTALHPIGYRDACQAEDRWRYVDEGDELLSRDASLL
jgi:hypothetical protein